MSLNLPNQKVFILLSQLVFTQFIQQQGVFNHSFITLNEFIILALFIHVDQKEFIAVFILTKILMRVAIILTIFDQGSFFLLFQFILLVTFQAILFVAFILMDPINVIVNFLRFFLQLSFILVTSILLAINFIQII